MPTPPVIPPPPIHGDPGALPSLNPTALNDDMGSALSAFYGSTGSWVDTNQADQSYWYAEWSTITDLGGFGFLRYKEIDTYTTGFDDTYTVFGPGCTSVSTRVYRETINSGVVTECVIIDNESFPTISDIGPFNYNIPPYSTGEYDLDYPYTVYPRYYKVGEDTVYFLISICRYSEYHGNRWQYGIFRSSVEGDRRWLFNVEFPISNVDYDGPGPLGTHVIPEVSYKESPVYCNGTFRLIEISETIFKDN